MNKTDIIAFETHDHLGRKEFASRFEEFLITEHDFVEGSLVACLRAPFGSGKSHFLSMWKSDLEKRQPDDPSLPQPIIVNAWENDFCGDPLLSIVTSLIRESGDADSTNEKTNKLREAAKDVAWFLAGLANNAASHFTGLDPVEAGKLAEEKRQGRHPKIPDFITLYEERTKALDKLKVELRSVYGGDEAMAIVIVDELDRCRPDYAISYLETIKHIFDVHGLIFVLAVDYNQLECSAKALFGQNLVFPEYFRKFVHRSIDLPEPSDKDVQQLVTAYSKRYIKNDKRNTCMIFGGYEVAELSLVSVGLRLTPRQIQEVFRLVGHLCAASTGTGQLSQQYGVSAFLAASLRVARPSVYDELRTGKLSCQKFGTLIRDIVGSRRSEYWFWIFASGLEKFWSDRLDEIVAAATELGFWSNDKKEAAVQHLQQKHYQWGHDFGRSPWQVICDRIESVKSFAE